MNLRYFHVLFILASVAMAAGVGIWAVAGWWQQRQTWLLLLALLMFAGAGGLVAYTRRFIARTSRFPFE